MSAPRPYNLVAELTYRCPLRCAYCSNPLGYREVRDGLDALGWARVFEQAAQLGVVHAGLSGGEPSARSDLPEIVRAAAEAGLYTHLVSAGVPLGPAGLAVLQRAGLRSLQLSIQDARPAESDAMAGAECFEAKLAVAARARELGLPLTLNTVLHRGNLDRIREIVALARPLGAERLELAHVQYHGWALPNRAALLPSQAQLQRAEREVADARATLDRPEILYVPADYHRGRPKPCMGGWGRRSLVVAPDGRVLPCHAAAEIPGLEFWSAADRPLVACWQEAPGMNAFRGEEWMREPCRSCPERQRDFGGCRCQAWALTGDAAATDPACALAPAHQIVATARTQARSSSSAHLVYRGGRTAERCSDGDALGARHAPAVP